MVSTAVYIVAWIYFGAVWMVRVAMVTMVAMASVTIVTIVTIVR
jgi:hypothetical protein